MKLPIVIYDNLCTSCTLYAKYVDRLARGRITMVGHYTQRGKELKTQIFPVSYEGLEMSWFVTDKHAYGGRKGLVCILKYLLKSKEWGFEKNHFDLSECTTDCRTVKGVLFRSCSILTMSKIIKIE